MNVKHYKERLSEFVNHELTNAERQAIGEHLLQCADCRTEHDRIKLGAELAGRLEGADAPENVWNKIEIGLNGETSPQTSPVYFFNLKNLIFASVLLIAVLGLTAVIYRNFFSTNLFQTAENPAPQTSPGWQVESLAGQPRIVNSQGNEILEVGETLETDENSSAKIDVADIGQVEIAPNSLVKLVNSSEKEHRLALMRGTLEAQIYAPPRLFVVDTPTAAAVDLGCIYKLEVDEAGNSQLHVKSGYVSLESEGRESLVPAGAFCKTRHGKGLGTPYLKTASADFLKALNDFDFAGGGTKALHTILKESRAADTLTLWHLIRRVPENDREKVFEKIRSFAKLPPGTTREGILRLDKNMLTEWRSEMEMFWYE